MLYRLNFPAQEGISKNKIEEPTTNRLSSSHPKLIKFYRESNLEF